MSKISCKNYKTLNNKKVNFWYAQKLKIQFETAHQTALSCRIIHIQHTKESTKGGWCLFCTTSIVGEIQECPKNEKKNIYNKYTFSFSVSRARILGDRDVLVQVGSDINLTCRAEESPEAPAAVVWYKNEERVDNLLARSVVTYVFTTA